MNHVLTHPSPVGAGLAVDIASLNSRVYWLVPVRLAHAVLKLPSTVFTSFREAVAARASLDAAPPIEQLDKGALRVGEPVAVDGVGAGRLAWIHTNGDVRVSFDTAPEHAEYYPIAAIRRAVHASPAARFAIEEISAGRAHALARALGGQVAGLRDGTLALALRRNSDDAVLGVIACARPLTRAIDDGLTLEIRGVALATESTKDVRRLLGQIGRLAAERGYTRLAVRGLAARQLEAALEASGWDRLRLGHVAERGGASSWWTKVLRASELPA